MWQGAFIIDYKAIGKSTVKKDLEEVKDFVGDSYLEYKCRHGTDLPIITRNFLILCALQSKI